jgi:hypothetical protein
MWGILFWTKDGSHFGNFNMARYCIYMGRRGKDLTPEVKKIILDLLKESYSGHKLSQVVGVIPRTVKKN